MKLTDKEKGRADNGITMVVREQSDGRWLVAAVYVDSSEFVFKPTIVDAKEKVAKAVAEEMRFLNKCALGGQAADSSRTRAFCLPF